MAKEIKPPQPEQPTVPAVPWTPAEMVQRAITSGASIEVMERLLALQEKYDAMQARKAYDEAMATCREELPAIVKNRTVDFTTTGGGRKTYKYEDLSAVVDAVSPVLAKYGLSFRWRTASTTPDSITVTCVVSHRAGHSEDTELTAKHDHSGTKNDIQALGSAVTYLQRYTLKAALGIAAGVDDDGQSSGSAPGDAPTQSPLPVAPPPRQGPKKYAFTENHKRLKARVEEWVKEHKLNEEQRKAMLVTLTKFNVTENGVEREVPGVDSYDLMSEKRAAVACGVYDRKVKEYKEKLAAKAKAAAEGKEGAT